MHYDLSVARKRNFIMTYCEILYTSFESNVLMVDESGDGEGYEKERQYNYERNCFPSNFSFKFVPLGKLLGFRIKYRFLMNRATLLGSLSLSSSTFTACFNDTARGRSRVICGTCCHELSAMETG